MNLPANVGTSALARLQEAVEMGIAPALAIMLDDALFAQVQKIANIMSKADGFVPKHCIGRTEVCFAIATRALVWKLDVFAVAQSTYQPVDGAKVAYEAKLVQAILEQSGRLDGPITREYHGDWSKVQGKFRMQASEKSAKRYPVATWPDEAETGLGITVSALLKGERERRSVDLDLRQCHPRNSTLWSVDPKTQIYYRAVRMLGNVAMPGVLMGVPFLGEVDDDEDSRANRARNVTPVDNAARAATPPDDLVVVDPYGEELSLLPAELGPQMDQWCRECTDDELISLKDCNPSNGLLITTVDSALEIRAAKRTKQQEDLPLDEDPLKINGLSTRDVIGKLEFELMALPKAEADRILAIYRPRLEAAAPKAYASLAALVAEKIGGGS